MQLVVQMAPVLQAACAEGAARGASRQSTDWQPGGGGAAPVPALQAGDCKCWRGQM